MTFDISRATESAADQALNVEFTLRYLLKKGARPEKTVLGVPLYGRAFSLVNPNSNRMGAPARDTSFQVLGAGAGTGRVNKGAESGAVGWDSPRKQGTNGDR